MGGDKGGEQQRWAAERPQPWREPGQRRASGVQAAPLIRRTYLGAHRPKKVISFAPSVCAENQGRPRRWGRGFLVRVV